VFPAPPDIVPKSGVLYKATYASREKGEKLAKHVAGKFISIIQEEFKGYE
jgi:creatinine amidohydrolase/Fe(II)-dependent formamide hydrolase-like protein